MNDHRIATVLSAAVFACVSCTVAPGVNIEAEASTIRQLDRQWQAAVEAGDVDACLSFYAQDAVEMQPNVPMIQGLAAIRTWFESGLLQPGITNVFTPDTIEVAASGDLAYERGTYRFRMETPYGDVDDVGKYLMIWKKVDGQWKVAADISNSDRPAPGDRR